MMRSSKSSALASFRRLGWGREFILLVRDPVEDGTRLEFLWIDIGISRNQGNESFGVGVVIDGEIPRQSQLVGVRTQDTHRAGVEGGHPHGTGTVADEVHHPPLHLGSGLVGEGDGKDRPRVHPTLGDQVGDPASEHPRLAGTRTSDDEYR